MQIPISQSIIEEQLAYCVKKQRRSVISKVLELYDGNPAKFLVPALEGWYLCILIATSILSSKKCVADARTKDRVRGYFRRSEFMKPLLSFYL